MNKNFKYTIFSFASMLMFSTEIFAKTAPSFDCNKVTAEKILPPHCTDTSGESPKSPPVFSCTKMY